MLLTNANGSIILKMINEIVAVNKQEYKIFISKVRLIICLLSLNSKALDFEINKNRFLTRISEYRVFSYIFLEPTTTFGISNYFFFHVTTKEGQENNKSWLEEMQSLFGV